MNNVRITVREKRGGGMKKASLELLKSGNFTLLYHDNGYCTLHPGKIKYEQSNDEEKNYVKATEEFSDQVLGYAPDIVVAMVKALGGKIDSI